MRVGPWTISFGRQEDSITTLGLREKSLPPLSPIIGRGGWWPIVVRDPYPGAWQRNDETRADTALAFSAVFACVTLISGDAGKLRLVLVEQDNDGVWVETESPSYSPVLRKPNRYQTTQKFVEQWTTSKLTNGNTYVLKQRDSRQVVTAMYVLDPSRVTPLVAPDGEVYYQLQRDDISNIYTDTVVPASEIIHDTMICLFHPLIGVTPIYACALAATQGMAIQRNSAKLFANGSQPGGILTTPNAISEEQATFVKKQWMENYTGDNVGMVAVLGDGLKYEGMTIKPNEAQLIEQLKWTAETVCSCYHVPPALISVGPEPPYQGAAPLLQRYYSQCLQTVLTSIENAMDDGLGLSPYKIGDRRLGTMFDIDELIWMDAEQKTKAATDGIRGVLSTNESRKKYFNLPRVKGGDAVYSQQQNYSLEALAERDQNDPFAKPAPASAAAPAPPADGQPSAGTPAPNNDKEVVLAFVVKSLADDDVAA